MSGVKVISFICQCCGGELHLRDKRPEPYGTWGCWTCRRVFRYGVEGWSEVNWGLRDNDSGRVLQSPGSAGAARG